MLSTSAAVVAAAVCVLLALFQAALALGAPWGVAAYGGSHTGRLPRRLRVTSAVAVPVVLGVGLLVLRRAGLVGWSPLPDGWLSVALWVLAGMLVVSTVLNVISRSPVERASGLPTAAVLLAAVVTVQLTAAPLSSGG